MIRKHWKLLLITSLVNLLPVLVGLVIGTEREYTNRPAGMRTHVLVALGACVVAITGMVLHSNYEADPGRLGERL